MNNFNDADTSWMQQAFELAKQAQELNEVPVGAVIVVGEKLIGSGFNQPISSTDPTAHAEIIALRQAAKTLRNYRLIDATLYVTLEPCAMCKAAMIHARIKRLVFAASDPKSPHAYPNNHRIDCQNGLLEQPCAQLLKDFFRQRR